MLRRMDDFFDELAPMFEPFFGHFPSLTTTAGPHAEARLTEEGVELEMEIPRYRPEDVKVEADATTGRITISGQHPRARSSTTTADSATSMSSFRRSYKVPTDLFDVSKMQSVVEHGCLTVRIPRRPPEARSPPRALRSRDEVEVKNDPKANKANAVALTSSSLRWPPELQIAEKPAPGVRMSIVCNLPPEASNDNVHVQFLDHDRIRVDVTYRERKESANSFVEHNASFSRIMQLPPGTKKSDVSAAIENGQLTVSVKDTANAGAAPAAAGASGTTAHH
jgi:HSP20 family molecular chaperone IbpA